MYDKYIPVKESYYNVLLIFIIIRTILRFVLLFFFVGFCYCNVNILEQYSTNSGWNPHAKIFAFVFGKCSWKFCFEKQLHVKRNIWMYV